LHVYEDIFSKAPRKRAKEWVLDDGRCVTLLSTPMNQGSIYLGTDSDASSVTVLLIPKTGAVRGAESADYPPRILQPGWAEQNPEHRWRAATEAVNSALAGYDTAVAWTAAHTTRELGPFYQRVPQEVQISVLGNSPATGCSGPNLMWTKAHESNADEPTSYALLPKDHLRYRLTSTLATDPSDAPATPLLTAFNRRRAKDALEEPELFNGLPLLGIGSDRVAGTLSTEAAGVHGLEPATHWVEGRAKERREGRLQELAPGEARRYRLEIGVLTSQEEIATFTAGLPAVEGDDGS
jgi:xylulokinase